MLPGVPERRSFDYGRHGTVDLLVALNIAGKVISRLSAQHRAVDFRDFPDQIDRQADPALAVHVICDSLSAHKAPVVQHRLLARPRFALHFTRPAPRGSTRSSGGSPNCSADAWTAACSARSMSSPPRSRTG